MHIGRTHFKDYMQHYKDTMIIYRPHVVWWRYEDSLYTLATRRIGPLLAAELTQRAL
jgi:hypothetical protein